MDMIEVEIFRNLLVVFGGCRAMILNVLLLVNAGFSGVHCPEFYQFGLSGNVPVIEMLPSSFRLA